MFILNAIKIIFLLGFLIFIHEGGHFIVAKLCKVKVNEFAIGFGRKIFQKQKGETKYTLRLIPLGGFVSMEGETEYSEEQGSFTKASIPKRMAIVAAGGIVNILFAVIVYFIVMLNIMYVNDIPGVPDTLSSKIGYVATQTGEFAFSAIDSLKMLVTGRVTTNDLMGPIGISTIISQTNNFREFFYMMALISLSLGITNLLPIPALDGGKLLLLLIEAIRRKPLKLENEIKIQLLGFMFLIGLSILVTYNDIVRIVGLN